MVTQGKGTKVQSNKHVTGSRTALHSGFFFDHCGKVMVCSDCDWCYLPLISPAVIMTWSFFLILFHLIQFVYFHSSSFSFVIRTNIQMLFFSFYFFFVWDVSFFIWEGGGGGHLELKVENFFVPPQ